MVTRERAIEDQLIAVRAERDFLREVVKALVTKGE